MPVNDKPRDWGYEAQQAAEKHLALVQEWFYYYESEDIDGEPTEPDPSSAPYDGCDTCMIREVLFAAWPIIEEGLKSELEPRQIYGLDQGAS